ncbi:hypothetical protein [Amycolatopsis sp. PS_44_ISF1]|uniref:hypothetical protein n=1 Tax=Amycolatopsis sp. PS_44_ISF1 TaxID=2974917 RepID=UPI0028DEB640|nr:hypothetical protein [Amycolatopsis sp. PS_44_ISF1]MDT8913632.1 hypothetical protein [Amycolatopsis sp. PS_44_ISF1]
MRKSIAATLATGAAVAILALGGATADAATVTGSANVPTLGSNLTAFVGNILISTGNITAAFDLGAK